MNVLRFADLVAQGRVRGQRVFIRADLNVPQGDAGRITEDTRIRASVPCIRMALDAGAAVMVTSHLGRPTEGAFKPEDSLAPVAERLSELLGRPVPLKSNWVDGVDVAPVEIPRHVRHVAHDERGEPALAPRLEARPIQAESDHAQASALAEIELAFVVLQIAHVEALEDAQAVGLALGMA